MIDYHCHQGRKCKGSLLNPNSIEYVSTSFKITEDAALEFIHRRNNTPFYKENHKSTIEYKNFQAHDLNWFIDKYGNPIKDSKQLIFPILNDEQTEAKKFSTIKNFTRFINQNLKKLAKANNITSEISTYWARHSFATNAIRSGLSMEFVGEALSHSNIKTTQGYFAGFEEENKKELMEKLMEF